MSVMRTDDLPAALAALASGTARPLAGGTDLMVQWTHGAGPTAGIVDIWRVRELRYMRRDGEGVRVGALTTCTDLLRAADDALPGADLWRAVAREFAAEQIRNRATLGGNLATASPASDLAPVLLALAGVVRLRSASGARDVPADEFFPGYRRTACRADELIESVWLPDRQAGERRGVHKVGTRAAQAIAKVSVVVCARMANDTIESLRAAAGSVADRPKLLPSLTSLVGTVPTAGEIERVARRAALADCHPIDDVRGSAEYRRHALARVLRTLLLATCGPTRG